VNFIQRQRIKHDHHPYRAGLLTVSTIVACNASHSRDFLPFTAFSPDSWFPENRKARGALTEP